MELANIKLNLAKKFLNTNDKELLNYIRAVLDSQPSSGTWYEDLPDEIRKSLDQGLIEAEKGEGLSHDEFKKTYSKWLKK